MAPESFQVENGLLRIQATTKKKSHLFYDGPGHRFKNFELRATVRAEANSNGGIFFHTDEAIRDRHKHLANGYEVQLNSFEKEPRKTGILCAVFDYHQSPVDETHWFDVAIRVVDKRITVRIKDKVVVDYTEPESPIRTKTREGRLLSPNGGKIALQAHDRRSVWYFKEIKIRSF